MPIKGAAMNKIKVLIVEDEALIALQLKMSLKQAGYELCEPVARGEDAIAIARQEKPDVILMDIRLIGDMNGIEAARQIVTFSSAKIIFTTGHSDASLKAHAMELNPTAYLVKPIEISSIQSVLREMG
jgi:DNA-binding NarL/FixJ family response regulator